MSDAKNTAPDPAPDPATWSQPLRVCDLPTKKPTPFSLHPEGAVLRAIRDHLGLSGLRKLVFTGEIRAVDGADWQLRGHLGATVQQPCVVTLAPVSTRIQEDVMRRYLRQATEYQEGSELEMPEDDNQEPLAETIDPGVVMVEALALALPLFPRAPGAELGENTFTEPGKSPLSDADARPFAGLGALRDKLQDEPD
jgi:uncharacterized metal-binding protein YceD (DUF177 family)